MLKLLAPKGTKVDILGIGPLELVLIMIVALLVFGPDKLPEIGAKMGKGVRELRQLSREISAGVNTLTEPVDELRKPFDDAAQVVHQVSDTAESLRNPGRVPAKCPHPAIDGPKRLSRRTGEYHRAAAQPGAAAQPARSRPGWLLRRQSSGDAVEAAIEPAAPLAQPADAVPPTATDDRLTPESPSQASEH